MSDFNIDDILEGNNASEEADGLETFNDSAPFETDQQEAETEDLSYEEEEVQEDTPAPVQPKTPVRVAPTQSKTAPKVAVPQRMAKTKTGLALPDIRRGGPAAKPAPKPAPVARQASEFAQLESTQSIKMRNAELPKKHTMINRELLTDLFIKYLGEFEHKLPNSQSAIIKKGELLRVFKTRRQIEGLFNSVESFVRETLCTNPFRFAGIGFKHRPSKERGFVIGRTDPTTGEKLDVWKAATIDVVCNITLQELRGDEKPLFTYTVNEAGECVFTDPDALDKLAAEAKIVDALKNERSSAMNRSLKRNSESSQGDLGDLSEDTEELA